ncbi:unnamed protein product [Brachionus calyciflorus]|uniref:C2H2-type domain-containing protein n=1 Tax=Brachionus calyciflorus TaxID=104777 RepID=A0A813UP76_9BILA|nr:unnamed protein product [Brachionus calyciflorus]
MSKIHEYDDDDDKNNEVLDLSVKNNKRKNNKPFKTLDISTELEEEPVVEADEIDYENPEVKEEDFLNEEDNTETDLTNHLNESECEENLKKNKKIKAKNFDLEFQATIANPPSTSKKQMRFKCIFCTYKSHSVSLMQNHIYRHIDTTPYSCFYCGHKSTTKSTIMVHIELCHPNMEVKIKENRVKEEDYYLDLNSSNNLSPKIEIKTPKKRKNHDDEEEKNNNSTLLFKSFNSTSPSVSSSSESSLCSSPPQSPNPIKTEQLQFIKTDEDLLPNIDEEKDPSNYNSVFNRPKQYFGSLYEPDKQYSCKLCTYTTNHKPSMEDHVYVHTNTRPYRCGYCNEEIYTRYAATYHNKYKHPGEARNFIKDEQDVSIYYVNRAKKSGIEEEKKSEENKHKKIKLNKESSEVKKPNFKIEKNEKIVNNINQNHQQQHQAPQASQVPGYDFNLALKMYQIQLQSFMAANYLQSMRNSTTSVPSAALLASYFGLNQEQLLNVSRSKSNMESVVSSESDEVDSSLNETENSDKNESFIQDESLKKCKKTMNV